jgi:lysozyme family protein
MENTVPEKYKSGYEKLFASCIIKPAKYAEIDKIITSFVENKARYEAIGKPINVPWFIVAIIHNMECNLSFKKHLHNGDPLTARTIQVPKGRPKLGNPPFSFEVSAADALIYDKLDIWDNWSIAGCLFKLEGFNGFGYYAKGINSPYLWSYSNHYTKGKYVADGVYDPNAVSKQLGVAILLRRLKEKQLITFPDITPLAQIKALGEKAGIYNPNIITNDAKLLQQLLNSIGAVLKVDGKAGPLTSNEYKNLTKKYLMGDPRRN